MLVGRGEVQEEQLFRLDPNGFFMLVQVQFPLDDRNLHGAEADIEARILVVRQNEPPDHPDLDPQLFADLPLKAFFEGLPRFDPAAREFPLRAARVPVPAPGDEDPPRLVPDDGRCNHSEAFRVDSVLDPLDSLVGGPVDRLPIRPMMDPPVAGGTSGDDVPGRVGAIIGQPREMVALEEGLAGRRLKGSAPAADLAIPHGPLLGVFRDGPAPEPPIMGRLDVLHDTKRSLEGRRAGGHEPERVFGAGGGLVVRRIRGLDKPKDDRPAMSSVPVGKCLFIIADTGHRAAETLPTPLDPLENEQGLPITGVVADGPVATFPSHVPGLALSRIMEEAVVLPTALVAAGSACRAAEKQDIRLTGNGRDPTTWISAQAAMDLGPYPERADREFGQGQDHRPTSPRTSKPWRLIIAPREHRSQKKCGPAFPRESSPGEVSRLDHGPGGRTPGRQRSFGFWNYRGIDSAAVF